eukprot:1154636-Pelagomonas_calceolata.AAC.2
MSPRCLLRSPSLPASSGSTPVDRSEHKGDYAPGGAPPPKLKRGMYIYEGVHGAVHPREKRGQLNTMITGKPGQTEAHYPSGLSRSIVV